MEATVFFGGQKVEECHAKGHGVGLYILCSSQ